MSHVNHGNPGVTMLLLVLDNSSSMYGVMQSVIDGVKALVKEQRQNGHDEILLGYTMFDWGVHSSAILPIDEQVEFGGPSFPYGENMGSTALFSGVAKTIKDASKHIARLPEEERPGRVVLITQTDGGENASKTSLVTTRDRVTEAHNDGWELTYLGMTAYPMQEQYQIQQANSMGFRRVVTYSETKTAEMVHTISRISVALRTGVEIPETPFTLSDIGKHLAREGV